MRSTTIPLLIAGVALGTLAVAMPAELPDPIVVEVEASGTGMTVTWAGDTMLGDAAEEQILLRGAEWTLGGVRHLLPADVRIVNGETPLTRRDDPAVDKEFVHRSAPETASALAASGIDVVGLANNHSMDQGAAGLVDTTQALDEAGLAWFGAGSDLADAERPLLLVSDEVTVAVVGLAEHYGEGVTARHDSPGTVALSNESIIRGKAAADRAGADVTIGFVHWGDNYETEPNASQATDARRFAAAGYDLVIGHGPHVVQPATTIGDTPVFFSVGNYVFGTPGRFNDQATGEGLVLRTHIDATGVTAIDVACIATDNDVVGFRPRPCSHGQLTSVTPLIGVGSVG